MDRFWKKTAPSDDGCILWTASTNGKGYGRFGLNGKNQHAHRVAFKITHGTIPPNMVVMHSCDNPRCVNPSHLRIGTVAENNADKMNKSRHRSTPIKGERNGQSKLTQTQVDQIRSMGGTSRVVASRFGVSPELIQQIRRGLIWR